MCRLIICVKPPRRKRCSTKLEWNRLRVAICIVHTDTLMVHICIPGGPVKLSQTHFERTIWHRQMKQKIYPLISLWKITDINLVIVNTQESPKTEGIGQNVKINMGRLVYHLRRLNLQGLPSFWSFYLVPFQKVAKFVLIVYFWVLTFLLF